MSGALGADGCLCPSDTTSPLRHVNEACTERTRSNLALRRMLYVMTAMHPLNLTASLKGVRVKEMKMQAEIFLKKSCAHLITALNESISSNQCVAASLPAVCGNAVGVSLHRRTQRPYRVDVTDLFSLWPHSKISSAVSEGTTGCLSRPSCL